MNSDQQVNEPTHAGEQFLFDWAAENAPGIPMVNREAAEVTHRDNTIGGAGPSPLLKTHAELSPEAKPLDGHRYSPNHPWHYIREGDNAIPVPFDEIPPAADYGCSLERELPKPAAKRIIKARHLLGSERGGLEEARTRYEDVISRGVEALSRYDREIAYGGNDELARAGTLALLYNQISWRRGRIAFLEQLQTKSEFRFR